jgi:uncharacterized protein YcaQ
MWHGGFMPICFIFISRFTNYDVQLLTVAWTGLTCFSENFVKDKSFVPAVNWNNWKEKLLWLSRIRKTLWKWKFQEKNIEKKFCDIKEKSKYILNDNDEYHKCWPKSSDFSEQSPLKTKSRLQYRSNIRKSSS